MKVTEYFVGFGPRLWSVRRGETEYGVKAIPAGGYVKIPGMTNLEEIDPADEARTYRRQPFHKRILVASAGSFMHFLMAFLLAYGALLYFGAPTAVQEPIAGFLHWSRATPDGGPGGRAAARATWSWRSNGKALTGRHSRSSDVVNRSADKPVHLTIDRDGRTRTVTVTPVRRPLHRRHNRRSSGRRRERQDGRAHRVSRPDAEVRLHFRGARSAGWARR